jgi:hypothetical protein
MLQPFRKVRSTRKLERWIARRTPTMLAAIAAGDVDDWLDCAVCLDAEGVDAVVIMLLDQWHRGSARAPHDADQ